LKEAGCSTMDLFYGFEFRTQWIRLFRSI
jgi:hypothetical protein